MPTVLCPACPERIEIDADWFGREVLCPYCRQPFTPARPHRDDEYDDRPRRRRESDDEYDDRPRRPRPRQKSPVLLILGIVGGALLLVGLGCGGFVYAVFFKPVDYSQPWVTQATPDGKCSAMFPRAPTAETLGDPGDEVGMHYTLIERLPRDAGFGFSAVDFDEDRPGLLEEVYREELAEILKATRATVESEKRMTWNGYPCVETEIRSRFARAVFRLIQTRGPTGPRMISIFAGGRNLSEADRKRFLDSLKVNR